MNFQYSKLTCLFGFAAMPLFALARVELQKPNVLLIITDQQNACNDPGEQDNLAIQTGRYNKKFIRARKLLREWYTKNNVTAGGKSLNLLNKKYFRL